MDDDPTGLKADGKDKDDGRNSREKRLSFKIRARHKYDHLVMTPCLTKCPTEPFGCAVCHQAD
jgi:hypothetical protein